MLGFRAWAEQHRSPRKGTSRGDLRRLHPEEREALRAALDALTYMRGERLSLRQAAERAGTTPAAVLRHAGSALGREHGRYVARPADRLLRVMTVLGPQGVKHEVAVRGSRVASLLGEHWSAVQQYVRTGDEGPLRRLDGRTVAGIPLETDPDAIEEWARRGELDVDTSTTLLRDGQRAYKEVVRNLRAPGGGRAPSGGPDQSPGPEARHVRGSPCRAGRAAASERRSTQPQPRTDPG